MHHVARQASGTMARVGNQRFTASTAVSAVLVTFVSRLADRYGPRIILAAAGLGLGAACFGMATATNILLFFIAFASLRALGQGSLETGVVTTTFTTPAEEPDPPANVRIIGDTNNSLTVSWAPPSYDGGSAVTGCKVQWMTVGQSFSSSRQESVGASARTHTITGLTEGEVYFVRVVAVTAVGDSDRSNLAYGIPGAGSDSYGVLE